MDGDTCWKIGDRCFVVGNFTFLFSFNGTALKNNQLLVVVRQNTDTRTIIQDVIIYREALWLGW